MAECPECGAELSVKDDVETGELFQCHDCGTELEVRATNPLKIEKAPEEEEDWGIDDLDYPKGESCDKNKA